MEHFPELFKSNQLTEGPSQTRAVTQEKSAPDWAVRKEEEEEEEEVLKEVNEVKGDETEGPRRPEPSQFVARSPSDLKAEKLNYESIQDELAGHSVRAKILLMQALRWVTWLISLAVII